MQHEQGENFVISISPQQNVACASLNIIFPHILRQHQCMIFTECHCHFKRLSCEEKLEHGIIMKFLTQKKIFFLFSHDKLII